MLDRLFNICCTCCTQNLHTCCRCCTILKLRAPSGPTMKAPKHPFRECSINENVSASMLDLPHVEVQPTNSSPCSAHHIQSCSSQRVLLFKKVLDAPYTAGGRGCYNHHCRCTRSSVPERIATNCKCLRLRWHGGRPHTHPRTRARTHPYTSTDTHTHKIKEEKTMKNKRRHTDMHADTHPHTHDIPFSPPTPASHPGIVWEDGPWW